MANFLPENELETLFLDAFADPARRPAFFRKFLDTTIYVMDDPQPSDGAAVGTGIRLLDINGIGHVPAFSSTGRIREMGNQAARFHEVHTRELLQSLPNRPLILNPGSHPTRIFNREEIAALLDGTLLVDY